jgi:tetratricopeptide (TPR) repeat protein
MLQPAAQLPGSWTPRKAFDAARINMRRGALAEASAFAQQACDGEPDCLEFRALHAWLRVQRGELKTEADAVEILAILTRALREQRHNLEIRLFRARVLQRLGRMEEAIRDFSVVASMDSKNLEAVREVRLYQARSQRKPSLSGILSKVFRREGDE